MADGGENCVGVILAAALTTVSECSESTWGAGIRLDSTVLIPHLLYAISTREQQKWLRAAVPLFTPDW